MTFVQIPAGNGQRPKMPNVQKGRFKKCNKSEEDALSDEWLGNPRGPPHPLPGIFTPEFRSETETENFFPDSFSSLHFFGSCTTPTFLGPTSKFHFDRFKNLFFGAPKFWAVLTIGSTPTFLLKYWHEAFISEVKRPEHLQIMLICHRDNDYITNKQE